MVPHISRVWINREGCQTCTWSAGQGNSIFRCPRSCLKIWSRETGSAVPSRVSLLISILRLNLVLTCGIPPEYRDGVHLFTIGSVPSLSSHAIAYRWLSLPRVRRHRASKPQGSSERVLPWQVTMDQLICTTLSQTHCWYEVGMLKVPADVRYKMLQELAAEDGSDRDTRTKWMHSAFVPVLIQNLSTESCFSSIWFACPDRSHLQR